MSLKDVKTLAKERKRDLETKSARDELRFLKERIEEKSSELTQSRDPKPERFDRILHSQPLHAADPNLSPLQRRSTDPSFPQTSSPSSSQRGMEGDGREPADGRAG
jgi:hypothetical protein